MQDKVVLITGGAKRVGAAICRRLHAAGANLMLHYRASAGEARLLQAMRPHRLTPGHLLKKMPVMNQKRNMT